jgi:hypothetical protein
MRTRAEGQDACEMIDIRKGDVFRAFSGRRSEGGACFGDGAKVLEPMELVMRCATRRPFPGET